MFSRTVTRIGRLDVVETAGMMLPADLGVGWAAARVTKPQMLLVDHTRCAFALSGEQLLQSCAVDGETPPTDGLPVAWILRPDLLPLYLPLQVYLQRHGFKRGVFLEERSALRWLHQLGL